MGRHASPAHASALPVRSPWVLLGAGLGVLLLLVSGLVWLTAGASDDEAVAAGCAETVDVRVTVAPEIAELTEQLLRTPVDLGDDRCALAEVSAQRPLETLGDLGALDPEALPEIWVPDSSLWPARVGGVPVDASGSLATSPVVLATSRAAAAELGWTDEPPAWRAALTAERPLAVGDLATSAEALSALAAVRESLGGGVEADNTVVEAVLATARQPQVSPAEALASAAEGGADAALVPISEQEVVELNRDVESPALVAVYPSEGSPALDYPVVRVGAQPDDRRPAVDAIVRQLTSQQAREAVQQAGFRTPEGEPFVGAGEGTGTSEEVLAPLVLDPFSAQDLLARITSLAAPSRVLAAFDVSTSMEAPVGDGSRATLARDAAKSAITLFPPNASVGLWFFAVDLAGEGQDWERVVETRPLGEEVDGRTQTELLVEQVDSLPERLTPGGTGLYDTTLAAVRAARDSYDPEAVNSVLVVTDGENDDSEGLALDELLATLRDEADPERPVKVIGVALGPDADLGALEQIAQATGGSAYPAVEEEDLQQVLFDALRQRG